MTQPAAIAYVDIETSTASVIEAVSADNPLSSELILRTIERQS